MKFDLGLTPHRPGGKNTASSQVGDSELREIEDALERLETGDFGYCESCGGEIELSRLCADPTTSKCLNCLD